MERLNKFLRLPSTDRRLLIKSVLLVGAIRVGLRLLPFQTVRRFVVRLTTQSSVWQGEGSISIDQVVWAVTVASHYVPDATCLTQALATQVQLGRRGQPTSLRIGVAQSETGQFQAHAWVEKDGVVVIGGPASHLQRYTPLPAFGDETL